jgi:dethiobiotin synthetase
MVPLNERHFVRDLIIHLNFPVLVVARSGLGTINHTLLTLGALRAAGIEILGVLLNGPLNPGNVDAIETYGDTKVVAQIEPLELTISSITFAADKMRNELIKHLPHLASLHANEDSRLTVTG